MYFIEIFLQIIHNIYQFCGLTSHKPTIGVLHRSHQIHVIYEQILVEI